MPATADVTFDLEIPYMSPLAALQKWLVQTRRASGHDDYLRRVETLMENVRRADGRALRGLMVADDLCLTRRRVFYRLLGTRATELTLEEVAAQYVLADMQARYKIAMDAWKSRNRRIAS
jgi:hypothetical protein